MHRTLTAAVLVTTFALMPAIAEDRSTTATAAGTETEAQEIYDHRCGRCHGSARDLAAETLRLKDGKLLTRKRGIDLRAFMDRHGRATPPEADRIQALLAGYVAER